MLEAQRSLVEALRREAQELLDLTDQADKEAWYQNPCTQYLIKMLTADQQAYQSSWSAGGYTEESSSGTLQKNSKYIGMIQQADETLDDIERVKAKPIKEDLDGADPE